MRKEDVYQVSDEDFIQAIKDSNNIHEALIKMRLNSRGAAYKTFNKRCKKLNVDLSHFRKESDLRKNISNEEIVTGVATQISRQATLKSLHLNPHSGSNVRWLNQKLLELNINSNHWLGEAHLKGKTHSWTETIPLEKILVQNSTYTSNTALKNRLLKNNLLEYKCYNLQCGISEWHGKPISLQLEHINGNNTDNRIQNLCLLCPNCHSQTDTFAGKNIGRNGRT